MPKRILCKFFAHGACLKGEHCEFSHDRKDPANNVCTYYQKGICTYGSRCRYEHVKLSKRDTASSSSSGIVAASAGSSRGTFSCPIANAELSATSKPYFHLNEQVWKSDSGTNNDLENGEMIEPRNVKPEDRPLCSFAAAGDCPRGDKCPHIHGDSCPYCEKNCLHPFRREEREEHLKICEKKQKSLEAHKLSLEIECSVCLERVLSESRPPAERKFGILSECDHPFCISCIRNWRNSCPTSGMDVNTAVRACPICRKLSYFVVPSINWYSFKEEKQEIIDSYKAKLSSIDCKHFNFGNGNCPFGTSCFYKHTVKRGSYTWKYGRPPPRRPRPHRFSVDDMSAILEVFGTLENLLADDLFDDYDEFDEDDLLEQYDIFTVADCFEEDDLLF